MKRALPALRRPTAMLAGGLLALGIISVVAADGHEADPAVLDDIIGAVDTAWLLIAGFLVFFMQGRFPPCSRRASCAPTRRRTSS